jgi:hypothetical protein
MTGFTSAPDQLLAHAGRLARYADQLADLGAGLPDGLGQESLGSFAQFVTTGLGGAMTATLDAFAHASAAVDLVGGGVRQTAEDYQHADDDSAATLTGLEEGR